MSLCPIPGFSKSGETWGTGLEKFCKMKADERRRACKKAMTHMPRDPEVAADYAAKAQAYEMFVGELLAI